MVKHHLNAADAIDNYDKEQLFQFDIRNLELMEENTREALNSPNFALEKVQLQDKEVDYLVAFLKSLTDSCVTSRACLGQWIPDTDDPNGDQLNAVDQFGNSL